MKAMIMSDLLVLKSQLIHNTVLFVVMVVVVSLVTGGSPLVLLYVTPIMATYALQCFQQEEGKAEWGRLRLAMPLSRAQVIAGRYASLAVVVVASTVLGTAICLVAKGAITSIAALEMLAFHPLPFDAPTFVLVFGGVIGGALILLGLLLPLIARFGAVDGMRYAPGALLAVVMLAYYALFSSEILQNGTLPAEPIGSVLVLAVGLVAMGVTFYVASATIAIRLYSGRDF